MSLHMKILYASILLLISVYLKSAQIRIKVNPFDDLHTVDVQKYILLS